MREIYEKLDEPWRSILLRELDYDVSSDPTAKNVIRIPVATIDQSDIAAGELRSHSAL